jgi:hypothetical protein
VRDDDNEVRISRIARDLRAPLRTSASFDDRVMAAVRTLPRHSRFRLWSRLTTPRTVTVTPLSWGLLAASVALFAIFGVSRAVDVVDRLTAPIFASDKPKTSQRVQFVLVAPDAKKVAVVGDFNGWDAKHAGYQAQHRGGGVWSVTAPVPVGHHRYSFVVDDSLWVADPIAPRVSDNDFGVPSSAIVVSEEK